MLIDDTCSDGQIMARPQPQCTFIHHLVWVESGVAYALRMEASVMSSPERIYQTDEIK